jgi:hypothetical protein
MTVFNGVAGTVAKHRMVLLRILLLAAIIRLLLNGQLKLRL